MIELRPTTLQARGLRLEPLGHEHVAGLREAAQDGELWRLVYTSVPDPAGAEAYVAQALAGQQAGHMLPWAVLDAGTGEVLGSTRYHDVVAEADRVEIGYTWYRASRQRTHVNTTCKLLLLDYAFEVLGCGVVGLRTDVHNARSQRAIEALGATKDGVLRHHRLRRDGSVRDTVLYSILRGTWPGVRERLEARLARYETPED